MKKQYKQMMGFGTGVVATSVLGSVLGDIGGDIATQGGKGLTNMSKMYPATGTIRGAGMALGAMKPLMKATRRRK